MKKYFVLLLPKAEVGAASNAAASEVVEHDEPYPARHDDLPNFKDPNFQTMWE